MRTLIQPTYYVRHPDGSHSVADPQPVLGLTAESAEQREQGQAVGSFDVRNGFVDGVDVWANAALGRANGEYYLYTTPPTPTAVVPDGFVLVPIDPTLEMMLAGRVMNMRHAKKSKAVHSAFIYRAMLSAAPQPAAQTQERDKS